MKRERLEDLGRIYEKLDAILNECGPLDDCESKHTIDRFIEKYKNQDNLEELHNWMRWHREKLWEIHFIANGDYE